MIKNSNIKNGGLGVFAATAFRVGPTPLFYWGDVALYTSPEVLAAKEEVVGKRLLRSLFRVVGPPPCRFLMVNGSDGCAATYINSSEERPSVRFVEPKVLSATSNPRELFRVVALRPIKGKEHCC